MTVPDDLSTLDNPPPDTDPINQAALTMAICIAAAREVARARRWCPRRYCRVPEARHHTRPPKGSRQRRSPGKRGDLACALRCAEVHGFDAHAQDLCRCGRHD